MAGRRAPARRRDRGAAAVEFALVLPVFIALVFGIISYGWMLSYRQSMSQAAAEGARVIAVAPSGKPTTLDDARKAINRSLSSYGVACSGEQLTHDGITVGACTITVTGDRATVRLQHGYREHPLIHSFPGLGITLPKTLTYEASAEVSS